jgi:hypothetical protein
MRYLGLLLVCSMGMNSARAQDAPRQQQCTGLMVMAHGGSDEWNESVHGLVSDFREDRPVAVALGMANPATMEESVDSLLSGSVDDIVVVRLFLSSESFLGATQYVLGLQDEPPAYSMFPDQMRRLDIPVPVSISMEGLLDAPEVGGILRTRAEGQSVDPSAETVLLLAHGAGSDQENSRWLASMDALADSIRHQNQFASVRVETLREDWDEKRGPAEERIRAFVAEEAAANRSVIVVPFRVSGFGPYDEVLDGLDYRSDGLGLLPDARIADWIGRQLRESGAGNSCL